MDYHQQQYIELGVPAGAILNHRKCLKCGRQWTYLKAMEDLEKLIAEELIEAFWGGKKNELDP